MLDALRAAWNRSSTARRYDDAILQAIHDRTARGDTPVGTAYALRDGRWIVITMLRNADGISYESDACIVVAAGDATALGTAMRASIAGYGAVVARDLRRATAKDWPAFRASGAKSVRAFTDGAATVRVCAEPHGHARIQARPCRATDTSTTDLSRGASWDGRPETLGEAMISLVRYVGPCAETGLFAD